MISKGIETLLWKAYLLKNAILKQKIYAELKNIAKLFEEDVFAKLQQDGISEAFVEATEARLKISPKDYLLPVSAETAAFFKKLGIKGMKLDTLLESNQLLDILKDMDAMGKSHPLFVKGYEAYCAITKFFPESGILSVRYHYCELDYSKAIKSIKARSNAMDHRIFFQKAPLYGVVAAFLVAAFGLLYPYLPQWLSIILSILIGIASGILVFIVMQVVGSLEYDKEYLEKRLKEKK